jgi:hypothetical protein
LRKVYAQKAKEEKMCSNHRACKKKKKVKHHPLQNKSKRRISKQGVLTKTNKKIFHSLAHVDEVALLVFSWIRSLAQQHHVAQVSLVLTLPKAPHTSHIVGS